MLTRFLIIALALLALPTYAAVTRPDAATVFVSTASRTPSTDGQPHTVTSGTTVLVIAIGIRANIEPTAVDWNGNALTLVHDLDNSTSSADVAAEVWCLDSPSAATGNITYDTGGTVNPDWIIAVNYHDTATGTCTTTVSNLNEDINTTATNTSVHASGGTAGNALFFVGVGCGDDMDPMSNDAGATELYDTPGTGGGAGNCADLGAYFAELLDSAPSAITVTYNATDENAGGWFQVLAAGAPTGSTAEERRRRNGY